MTCEPAFRRRLLPVILLLLPALSGPACGGPPADAPPDAGPADDGGDPPPDAGVPDGAPPLGCDPDAFEEDDDQASASPLEAATRQDHDFCDDAQDWMQIDVQADQDHAVVVIDPLALVRVELVDSYGFVSRTVDPDPAGCPTTLVWHSRETGRRWIRAGAMEPLTGTGPATAWSVVTGPPAADLAASAVLVEPASGAGGELWIDDTVSNVGVATSTAARVGYFLSRDAQWDPSDAFLSGRRVDPVPPCRDQAGEGSARIPGDTAEGVWFLLVVADFENTVPELDEQNNVAVVGTLDVRQLSNPRLMRLQAPYSVVPGATTALHCQFYNTSEFSSPTTELEVVLSTDAIHDAADRVLGRFPVPALGAWDAVDGWKSSDYAVIVPEDLAEGTWHVLGRLDPDDLLEELDETDNEAGTTTLVQPLSE